MEKNKQQTDIITENFVSDIRAIIEQGQRQAYAAVGQIAVITYWNIGRRIVEEEQHGAARAQYGIKLIKTIADRLSIEFGTNYSERRLRDYRQFYLSFGDLPNWHSRVPNLTWTHFRRIMAVPHPDARRWYAEEASREMWSIRTLDRNISTQYYGRLCAAKREGTYLYNAKTNKLEPIIAEDLRGWVAGQQAFVKSAPVVLVLVSDLSKMRGGNTESNRMIGAMDAGIVSENISIACAGLGFVTVPRASMDKEELSRKLQLKDSQILLLNHPVGKK